MRPAGQKDDLHSLRGFQQHVRHHLQPDVVGVDERVVEDERYRRVVLQQKVGERQPSEDRELLLCPAAEVAAGLVAPCPSNRREAKLVIERKFGARKELLDVGGGTPCDWGEEGARGHIRRFSERRPQGSERDRRYAEISIETALRVGSQLQQKLSIPIERRLQGSVPLNVHIRGVSDVESRRSASRRFGVSEASAIRWVQRYERVGDRCCAGTGGHRPSKVKPERDWLLAQLVVEPDITLSALSVRLLVERGVRADTSMLSRFFIGEGISFKIKRSAQRAG